MKRYFQKSVPRLKYRYVCAVKILIDQCDFQPTGICLANSGKLSIIKKIKELLAGRINFLPIYPLSWQGFSGSTKQPGLYAILPFNF